MNKNSFNFEHLSSLPGEKLLNWLSVKGHGRISEFVLAFNSIANEYSIIDKTQESYFSYEKILQNYCSLLHLEYTETEWSVSNATLNVLPGVKNRTILTGSRNYTLLSNLVKITSEDDTFVNYFIDSSKLLDKTGDEFKQQLRRNSLETTFLPTTLLFAEYSDNELESISSDLGVHLNSVSPLDYVKALPSIDEYISKFGSSNIPSFVTPERFEEFSKINHEGFMSINDSFNASTGLTSEDGYLYRFDPGGFNYQYFVYLNNQNYFINNEKIGIWKQISRLEKEYIFFVKNDFLSGTLIVPSLFKFPQIYLKTLGFCLGVPPVQIWPQRDVGKNPKMNYFLNIPEVVATTLIEEKLKCKLIFIEDNNQIQEYF